MTAHYSRFSHKFKKKPWRSFRVLQKWFVGLIKWAEIEGGKAKINERKSHGNLLGRK